MFIIFMALLIAPSVAGPKFNLDLAKTLGAKNKEGDLIYGLFQPNNRTSAYMNDTGPMASDILAHESSVLERHDVTMTGGTWDPEQTGSSSGDDKDTSKPDDSGADSAPAEPQPKLVKLI